MNQKRTDEEIRHEKKEIRARERKEIRGVIIPYISVFLVTCALLLCFQIVNVDGDSMLDTYKDGDVVIVNRIGYMLSDKRLDRGDVIVVGATDNVPMAIIKRVIAVGGDEINIDFTSGAVTVNGEVLTEKYIRELTKSDEGAHEYPVIVPEGCFFIMGDNRNHSIDSRSPLIGFVSSDDIIGKVVFKLPSFGE